MIHKFSLKKLNLVVVIFIVLFFRSIFTFAGAFDRNIQTVDSLSSKFQYETREGSSPFDKFYNLTFECIEIGNLQQALSYIVQAQDIAKRSSDKLKLVRTTRVKAQILRRMDRITEAISEFENALPIAKRENFGNEYMYILNGLAVAYTFRADYLKALDYHFQLLIIQETEEDNKGIDVTLNNIGLVYFKLKNYNKALEYYNRALKIKNQYGIKDSKDRLLINIGLCYNYLGKPKAAQRSIRMGLKSCLPICDTLTVIAGEFGLGASGFELKDFQVSQQHFLKSYTLAKTQKDKRYQLENLVYVARIDVEKGNVPRATKVLIDAEKLAIEGTYNQLLTDIYFELGSIYFRSRDFENAAICQKKYINLKEGLFNEKLASHLAALQSEYEQRQNKAKIDSQAKMLIFKEGALEDQKKLNVMTGAGVLLFVVIDLHAIHWQQAKTEDKQIARRKSQRAY